MGLARPVPDLAERIAYGFPRARIGLQELVDAEQQAPSGYLFCAECEAFFHPETAHAKEIRSHPRSEKG